MYKSRGNLFQSFCYHCNIISQNIFGHSLEISKIELTSLVQHNTIQQIVSQLQSPKYFNTKNSILRKIFQSNGYHCDLLKDCQGHFLEISKIELTSSSSIQSSWTSSQVLRTASMVCRRFCHLTTSSMKLPARLLLCIA